MDTRYCREEADFLANKSLFQFLNFLYLFVQSKGRLVCSKSNLTISLASLSCRALNSPQSSSPVPVPDSDLRNLSASAVSEP